jgi:hypothetical protein
MRKAARTAAQALVWDVRIWVDGRAETGGIVFVQQQQFRVNQTRTRPPWRESHVGDGGD